MGADDDDLGLPAGAADAILAALPTAVFVLAPDGVITFASPEAARMVGRTRAEVEGASIVDFLAPGELDNAANTLAFAQRHAGVMGPMTYRLVRPDGQVRVTLGYGRARFDDPAVQGLIIGFVDHTGAALVEQTLLGLAAGEPLRPTLTRLLDALAEPPLCGRSWALRRGPEGPRLVAASEGHGDINELFRLARLAPAPWHTALTAGTDADLADLDDRQVLHQGVREFAHLQGLHSVSCRAVRLPDRGDPELVLVVWREEEGVPTLNQARHLARAVELAAFVIERDDYVVQLRHAATHDPLTGIANRAQFLEAVDAAAVSPVRDPTARTVIFYLDLDGFKDVNDQYGHGVGDAVLSEVARRLSQVTRPTDLVARFGGDEFAVLCRGIHGDRLPTMLAQRLLDRLAEPLTVFEHELKVGASIGIALSEPGVPPDTDLLDAADRALYAVKHRGKGHFLVAGDSA